MPCNDCLNEAENSGIQSEFMSKACEIFNDLSLSGDVIEQKLWTVLLTLQLKR